MDLINKMFGGSPRPVTQSTTDNAPKAQSPVEAAPKTTNGDEVVLTDQAQQLKKAEASMDAASGIDMDKVTSVKAAIANGSYHVDPEKLAANISKFESELDGLNG
ncbi:flagellar biosynthesis anti-sigma factor FlgM [Ferrimonas lipolytica]|uniref:Negative regulator of flagellin synthesis n=1 Tax=Ferrimonas lipolytica TaxID=2724191 RepID=A0A6H1UGB6_9GAMM|nr:flagellar biosynthesis anti-sigma factor FlgM [Ferrimonas lipolytica]QIZ77256.1 flagellar biosynthesis anti-sigma factor FlgM [Ferrimonas lipolytica]